MSALETFHLAHTPLAGGTTLIEASAGTGKTFTIAGLFLRLVIERGCSVREILVVTFTEAATEELRERIRQTLVAAAAAFSGGRTDDPFLQALLASPGAEAATLQARLDRALRGFDEAPIHTIHGFCQRMLKDRAFESGVLFDTGLMTDPESLLQEVADDFWRRQLYEASLLRVAFVLRQQFSPERWLPLLEAATRHPLLEFIGCAPAGSLEETASALEQAMGTAGDLWRQHGSQIRSRFGMHAKWANRPYNDDAGMTEAFEKLETAFSPSPTAESLESLEAFVPQKLQSAVRKTGKDARAPEHPFFEACAHVLECEARFVSALLLDLLEFGRAEFPRRKQALKVQSYDDLLTRLHAALTGEGGNELAARIRARYQAALIDEFQDTDPVQYQIFGKIFAGRDESPSSPLLFLIGDPKQAIYGFRGADIFTYLAAQRVVDRRYTLDHNWRSESSLVHAVNTLFRSARAPFVVSGIDFQPVDARGKADATPLTVAGRREAPLHIWFWPRGSDGKPIPAGSMDERLPALVATEIVRLLTGGARLGNRPLRPRDIAVLVMKNDQARRVQDALRALAVPSVLHTDASVFASPEAAELRRVLAGMAQPGQDRALRAALATDLMGVTGADLDDFARQESAWQQHLARFHRYREVWVDDGFMPMFRQWLREEQVRPRLLALADGERRLTNLLHLGEVLHEAALARRLGAGGLVQWLADHIAGDDKAEEHQLRLERDDEAVRLVTIHKSKGLEYPVVFCPFVWRSSEVKARGRSRLPMDREVCFHDTLNGHRHVRDLGSARFEENQRRAMAENLAENVRLFYVALTRARHRCYFVWGGFNLADTSAPAWLLHPPPDAGTLAAGVTGLQDGMKAHFASLDDSAMLGDLRRLEAASKDRHGEPTLAVSLLPEPAAARYEAAPPGEESREARVFHGVIPRDWRIASFSGLAAGRRDEAPDHDEADAPAAPPVEAAGIFAFPRGTKAGTCLHEMYERLDFQGSAEAMRELVEARLRAHGIAGAGFSGAVCDAIERTLRVPLDAAEPGFTLSKVSWTQRLNELEFCFPLKPISGGALRRFFPKESAGGMAGSDERLQFSPVRGFMKGYIDLVFQYGGRFFLVDWKSNWLGNRVEDYGPAAVAAEMRRKFYDVQYHLYAVALHQYLSVRWPGYDYQRDFGGVRYVFVRGVDPGRPELGVFADRPRPELIEELSATLIDRTGAGRDE